MSGQHWENYDVKREIVHSITREMLTAAARDQRWPDVVAGISARFSKLLLFCLLYNKSLNDWSLGEQWILFPENLNGSRDDVEGDIEIRGKQKFTVPQGTSH